MSSSGGIRILVLDNDERLTLHLVPEFESRGYLVKFINTSEATSLENLHDVVREAARSFRPHVAIVDLRLRDDDTAEDYGLGLAVHLTSSANILYSSYITIDHVRKSMKTGFVDCISKQHSPQELIDAVEKEVRAKSFEANETTMRWPHNWKNDQSFQSLFELPCNSVEDTINDIIFQLFPDNQKFGIGPIDDSIGTPPPHRLGRSVAFKVRPDDYEPSVIKLTNARRIQEECTRYNEFIKGRLRGNFHTRIEQSVEHWDIGGTAYSFVGTAADSLSSFSSYYWRENDPDRILQPLKYLFSRIWIAYYAKAQSVDEEFTLFSLYEEPMKLLKRMDIITEQKPSVKINGRNLDIENPVQWLRDYHEYSNVLEAKIAITHGDLHGENIFVDSEIERAWVIDFERTGYGHHLRDFAELEVDILTRLLTNELADDKAFLQLCIDLMTFDTSTGKPCASDTTANNPTSMKAYRVIDGLREIAENVTHFADAREYIWSLLFDAVFVAALSTADRKQRNRAYLLSAILCERLRIGHGAWPSPVLADALNAPPTLAP